MSPSLVLDINKIESVVNYRAVCSHRHHITTRGNYPTERAIRLTQIGHLNGTDHINVQRLEINGTVFTHVQYARYKYVVQV